MRLGEIRITIKASAIIILSMVVANSTASDLSECLALLEKQYKGIHNSPSCLSVANAGHPEIQYAVGMSYGFDGNSNKELELYLASANQNFVPAYLAVGHVLRSEPHNNSIEAINWYKRYIEAGGKGHGYVAQLVSGLYRDLGNKVEAEKWNEVCKKSSYAGCK